MEQTVKERITLFIKRRDISTRQFEKACGFSNGYVKGLQSSPTADKLCRIYSSYPELNKVWLLTGEGEMFNSDGSNNESNDESNMLVPLVPMSAFAGPIESFYQEGVRLSDCEHIVSPIVGVDLALPISGDSMEPQFPDGAIIYVKRINDKLFIPWGNALLLDTENGAFLKCVYPDDTDDEYVVAKSINAKYPPMRIPRHAVIGWYRVLNVSKSLMTM